MESEPHTGAGPETTGSNHQHEHDDDHEKVERHLAADTDTEHEPDHEHIYEREEREESGAIGDDEPSLVLDEMQSARRHDHRPRPDHLEARGHCGVRGDRLEVTCQRPPAAGGLGESHGT